jgi:hypothetical protein
VRVAWAVEYVDGALLLEHDPTHPAAVGGEVPFRAIEWARVARVTFESELARTTLDISPAPPGHQWSLRRRTWRRVDGALMPAYLLVLSTADVEVNASSTQYVYYWLADGATRESPLFDDPEVGHYACGRIHGLQAALMPRAEALAVAADAATSPDTPDA